MLKNEINAGETYYFIGSDSLKRKHLEGKPFAVTEIKKVFRRKRGTNKPTRVTRFFNDDGDAARADELEPLPDGLIICPECSRGVMEAGMAHPNGQQPYTCTDCGHIMSFP